MRLLLSKFKHLVLCVPINLHFCYNTIQECKKFILDTKEVPKLTLKMLKSMETPQKNKVSESQELATKIEVYKSEESSEGSSKTKESQSTIPIEGTQVVCVQNKVYIGGTTNYILVYNFGTDAQSPWEKAIISPEKGGCRNYALVEFQNQLVLIGGSVHGTKVYVRKGNHWCEDFHSKCAGMKIKPMQKARENATAVAYLKYIVVFGGLRRSGIFAKSVNSIEVYNAEKNTWTPVENLPYSGYMIQKCVSSDGFLFLLDRDGWTIRYCSLERLIASTERSTDVWGVVERKVHHRYSCLWVVDDALLTIAGHSSDGHIYIFDSENKKWKRLLYNGSLPAISRACCVPLGERKLFLCGGDSDMMGNASEDAYILSVEEKSKSAQVDTSALHPE